MSEKVEMKGIDKRRSSSRRKTAEEIAFLKERRASQFEGKTAHFSLCVFNLMNAILGSGILGLANALANLGYVLFTVLLILVAALAFNSIRLLLEMCDMTGITSYEAIGKAALGKPGKIITILSIITHTIGAMCSFLFIVKYELPEVMRTITKADECFSAWYLDGNILVIIVTVAVVVPLASAKNIGFLGYTSGFAMLCMIFFTVVIVIQKFVIPCPIISPVGNETTVAPITTFPLVLAENNTSVAEYPTSEDIHNSSNHKEVVCEHQKTQLTHEFEEALKVQECVAKAAVVNSKTPYAVPTMVFAFQCHASVLPIYLELTNPTERRMLSVSVISIGNIFFLYFIASLFGYLTFFNAVGPELLLMYSAYDPNNIVILLARIMVLICVIFSTPLLHFPCRRSIEMLLFENKSFSWIRHLGIMAFLLTLTDVLVIFVPTIREVFGFIGATSASMLVIILPSLFYIRLAEEPMTSPKKIVCICLVTFGIAFTIMSLTLIILSWL